jgi:hypothetical protein
MRRSAGLLVLAVACSEGTGPGTQYYSFSQVPAEAVAEVLVVTGVGPKLEGEP